MYAVFVDYLFVFVTTIECLREIVKKLFPQSTPSFSSPIPCLPDISGNTGRNLVEGNCKNYIFSQTKMSLIH